MNEKDDGSLAIKKIVEDYRISINTLPFEEKCLTLDLCMALRAEIAEHALTKMALVEANLQTEAARSRALEEGILFNAMRERMHKELDRANAAESKLSKLLVAMEGR